MTFKFTFNAILLLCVIITVWSFKAFDFVEVDRAVDWVIRFFALPIYLILLPSIALMYFKFIRQFETRNYVSKFWTRARSVFRVFILSLGLSFILMVTTLSIILLTNAYTGSIRETDLKAIVVNYEKSKDFRVNKRYITVKDISTGRIVDLTVKKQYATGDTIYMKLKEGRWGLLFAN